MCPTPAATQVPSPPLSPSPRWPPPFPAPAAAGFVFLAFGFNWVDAGGLLGGRLDEDIVRAPATGSKAGRLREVKRSHTM